jgi:hypothetical protein
VTDRGRKLDRLFPCDGKPGPGSNSPSAAGGSWVVRSLDVIAEGKLVDAARDTGTI